MHDGEVGVAFFRASMMRGPEGLSDMHKFQTIRLDSIYIYICEIIYIHTYAYMCGCIWSHFISNLPWNSAWISVSTNSPHFAISWMQIQTHAGKWISCHLWNWYEIIQLWIHMEFWMVPKLKFLKLKFQLKFWAVPKPKKKISLSEFAATVFDPYFSWPFFSCIHWKWKPNIQKRQPVPHACTVPLGFWVANPVKRAPRS